MFTFPNKYTDFYSKILKGERNSVTTYFKIKLYKKKFLYIYNNDNFSDYNKTNQKYLLDKKQRVTKILKETRVLRI